MSAVAVNVFFKHIRLEHLRFMKKKTHGWGDFVVIFVISNKSTVRPRTHDLFEIITDNNSLKKLITLDSY